MNVSFIPRAVKAGARVYATCRASTIARRRGRATGVSGELVDPLTGERGPKLVVEARKAVFLAASAIQSPLFLAENRIGVRSGALGQRLQAHPGTAVVGVFDQPVRMLSGATQGFESVHFWNERMKFETVGMPLELTAARLPSLGSDLTEDIERFHHLAVWGVQVRARAHGNVRAGLFGGTSIAYDMLDEDIRVLKRGVRKLTEMMFAAGAREVLPGIHGLPDRIGGVDGLAKLDSLPDDPRLFHTIAAHLFGTAIMGHSGMQSVVGPDFQTFDLPALYVIDSSVFPTNLGVNPQHTISAMAWLAAEQLLDRA